jgi:hypothetical protein
MSERNQRSEPTHPGAAASSSGDRAAPSGEGATSGGGGAVPSRDRNAPSGDRAARGTRKWSFVTAPLVILFLICIGQAAGAVIADIGAHHAHSFGAFVGGLRARDWIFGAFLASSAVYVWLQRAGVVAFFRSMHVGVSLVSLSCLAVLTGVLIPQIEGFEDPTERVTASNHESQYQQFRFAEGFFFYHLMHPYGAGMPKGILPPQVTQGLEKFGQRYGKEERDNREKEMKAAFSGQAKSAEIDAFVKTHDVALRRFFDVATALELNRTYKSNWFASLLGLLWLGVFFNTFKGRPSTWLTARKAGWFVVHCGVMILLLGGAWSKLKTDRGIMHLDTRYDPTDEYWAYMSPEKRTRMPFFVKVDRFARRPWKTLEVGFRDDNFKSRLPEYTLWPGRVLELDKQPDENGEMRPELRIEVKSLAERARVNTPRFWEAEKADDPKGIGALVELSTIDARALAERAQTGRQDDDPGRGDTVLLKPDSRSNLYYDPQWKYRVITSYGADPTADAHAAFPSNTNVLGYLDVRVAAHGDVRPTRTPFNLGSHIDVPGGYAIDVREATANFQLDPNGRTEIRDPRPLREQTPRNPAVWLSITKDGVDAERRLVLEGVDWEENDHQSKFKHSQVAINVEWERWECDGPPRFVLHWGASSAPTLIGEDGAEHAVAIGEALPLPGDTRLVPRQFLRNARFEKNIELLSRNVEGPKYDPDFYSNDPTGAELEVTSYPDTPRQQVERVRMASTDQSLADQFDSSDDRFYLRYYNNDKGFPFEWRSVLSIYQKDADGKLYKVDLGPESEREIRVNDYFYYRGYRFFQTNAIPELPTYSGIGVVYDPGIPIVLFGMYTIILGTVLAFTVRPIAEAYGKRARAKGAA